MFLILVVALVAVTGTLVATGAMPLVPKDDKIVRVWLMQGSVTNKYVTDFREEYESDHPGVKLSIGIKEWTGIGEAVAEALDGGSADQPDLIEVGNTQVAGYAASGKVRDLSDKVGELGGEEWLRGLAEPGRLDGRQFGVPFYAASRVVIYRKDMFKAAGITKPPKTRAEWLAVTEQLNQKGTHGIYLAGQNWYVLSGFIWDEGGELAVQGDDGHWSGALDSAEAVRGMEFYQQLQALGNGPKDADESTPLQTEQFANLPIAQIIGVPGQAGEAIASNPRLEDKLGFFPIPGKKAGKTGTVFTGGSELIIPKASEHGDEAYEVMKEMTGEDWQMELSKAMSCAPNKTTLAGEVKDPVTRMMAQSAVNGRAAPSSPDWAAVEGLRPLNPIKAYQTQVLTGVKPVKEAAKEASASITAALSGS
uniref:extracellular solute-binding protein n=1 Tax=Streptomyces smaragdinus TaxID=2585196 RepID=UPI002B1EDBD9|nr:extracellular solute-binding protein [Streptomyces smaragdinus]